MIQGSYEFLPQNRIIDGTPAAEAVCATADQQNAKRVFIVSSQTPSRNTAEVDKIRAALGDRFIGLPDECGAHVPRENVMTAAAGVRAANPDLIVTIGGGTPIDTGKVLLIVMAEGIKTAAQPGEYRIRVLENGSRHVPIVKAPSLRRVIVPTTVPGTEFNNLAGCSNPERKVKDLHTGRLIGAQVVILDPAVTIHTPEWFWLSTGIRAGDDRRKNDVCRCPLGTITMSTRDILRLLLGEWACTTLPRHRADCGRSRVCRRRGRRHNRTARAAV